MKRITQLPAGAAFCVLLGGLGWTASATAQTTDTFAVTATVVDSCTLTAGNTLAFGNYDPNSGTALDGETTVSVSCTNGTTADVALDLGANANVSTRRMVDGTTGTSFLQYELYSDSGRTTVWGTGGDAVTYTGQGVLSASDLTVYGRVPIAQDVSVDSYSDTITVTLTIN
ncbi:MAG: Csu type fimbrial protein [Algiphilus sp.]